MLLAFLHGLAAPFNPVMILLWGVAAAFVLGSLVKESMQDFPQVVRRQNVMVVAIVFSFSFVIGVAFKAIAVSDGAQNLNMISPGTLTIANIIGGLILLAWAIWLYMPFRLEEEDSTDDWPKLAYPALLGGLGLASLWAPGVGAYIQDTIAAMHTQLDVRRGAFLLLFYGFGIVAVWYTALALAWAKFLPRTLEGESKLIRTSSIILAVGGFLGLFGFFGWLNAALAKSAGFLNIFG